MAGEGDQKRKVFRQFAARATANSHNAIKACWIAIFAGGTASFVFSLHDLLNCADLLEHDRSDHFNELHCGAYVLPISPVQFVIYLALYLIYALTLFRFYVGNSRIFDEQYSEVFDFLYSLESHESLSGDEDEKAFEYGDATWRRIEVFILLIQSFVLVSLTTEMANPANFATIYTCVLFIDVSWIFFIIDIIRFIRSVLWSQIGKQEYEDLSKYFSIRFFNYFGHNIEKLWEAKVLFPQTAMKVWQVNNALTFIVLVASLSLRTSYFADRVLFEDLIIAVMLANCLVDLRLTWGFYVPRFLHTYQNIDFDAAANNSNEPP
jgi:hypothetical protein